MAKNIVGRRVGFADFGVKRSRLSDEMQGVHLGCKPRQDV